MCQHEVGVAEPETDVEAVEGAHATIEEGWLPIKPSEIKRSGLDSLGIDGANDAIARTIDITEEFDAGLIGQCLPIGFDDGLGIASRLGTLDERYELFVGECFEGGIGTADRVFTCSGGKDHRHIGRSAIGVLEESAFGDVTTVGYGTECTTHHAVTFGLLIELCGGFVGESEIFDPRHGG